jgi:predicted HAD superfamily Cof-like phosphohydrolase
VSKDWYADIQEFHKVVMQDDFKSTPHQPSFKSWSLRYTLVKEEMEETLDAIDKANLVEVADGIVDSMVVLLGTAVTCGIDIRPIWDAVHRANMAKKDGPMREDGKRLKPVGWKPPDIKSEIERQQKC